MDNDEADRNSPEEAAFPTPEEIDALLHDFQVMEVLGQGGMGIVYLAWQARLERHVAIKVLPEGLGEDLGFAEQFRSEARTMASLHHSHIAAVHDFGTVGGLHYLVMEHIHGVTLFDHFHDGTFSPAEIITIVLQVCDALDYAHAHGVIHRDIKSANILVGQDGMTKLVDFGLATLQAAPGVLKRRTVTGPNFGTPGYSAPELMRAGAHVDHRADIYSLAVVLYEGITGRTMSEAWTPPSGIDGVPSGLDKVIRKATKHEPQERYQSIDQFATDLRQLERGGVVSRPTGVLASAQGRRPHVRAVAHPKAVEGAGKAGGFPVVPVVLGIVVVVVVGFFLTRGGNDEHNDPRDRDNEILVTGLPDEAPPTRTSGEGGPRVETEADPEIEAPLIGSAPPERMPAKETKEASPPPAMVEAEQTLAEALKQLDALFADSRVELVKKYTGALERLRADAPASGRADFDAELARIRGGEILPETDAPGLHPPLVPLRATLRTEETKLAVPDAAARLALLDPHVAKLKSLRGGMFLNEDKGVTEIVDEAIGGHEATIAELREFVEARKDVVGGGNLPGQAVAVATRSVTLTTNGRETLSPRATGIGIFAGLHGRITQAEEKLAVPPADPDGTWEVVREANHDFLRTSGIYYQSPRLDFSKASFEVVEWTRGGPEKRLISGDRGFPMISGVAGRIGFGTAFAMRYDEKNQNWYCDGKGSQDFTRILVTNVDVGGNTMLAVRTREFPWKANDPEVKMIHRDEGFCVLTALHGPFDGGGEKLLLRVDEEDGYWYLGGQTGAAGLSATATAFILPAD